MTKPLEELRKIRLKKLEKLHQLGVDPYPAGWERLEARVKNQELVEMELGSEVVAAGRIRAWREHGGIIFADLHDDSGKVQLCFRKDQLPAASCQLSALLDIGDFLSVSGELFKTKSGELTVLVKDFKLLSKSLRPLPSQWYGLKDVEERYRKRYLDLLMNPEVVEVFKVRAKVVTLLRKYLNEHGFMEVETPVLQPIYGGASARPFVTRLEALDTNFYLRISDELYLKRLIVGGFEKVYEISKDFRNEGIDRQHSPEFTMLEFYWAYADYEDLMKFSEEMLSSVIKEIRGNLKVEFEGQTLDFTPPLPRVTYRDLVLEHTEIDIDRVKTEEDLREAISERGLAIKGSNPLGKASAASHLPGALAEGGLDPGLAADLTGAEPGLDLSGVVGYGPLLDTLYKGYCRSRLVQPIFLIDHPAELMPLAKRKPEDPSKIESVQLLAAGYEMFKAYSELNDPLDQKARWEEQDKLAERGLEEHETLDADYVGALEYAMPPTAGWGMGIDRLTAILTDQHTIRDVILFPLMRPERLAAN